MTPVAGPFAASLLMVLTEAAAPAARLAYDAPASCPSEAEFVGAVAARGRELAPGGSQDAVRVLVVTIRHLEAGFAGTFSVREGQGATGAREVRGRSCAEVADALAVVAAIELDPAAAEPGGPTPAPSPPSASPPSPLAGSPPTSHGSAAAPAARGSSDPATAEVRLRASMPLIPAKTETVRVGAGDLRFDMSRALSVLAGASLGFIPGVFMPRYDLQHTAATFVTTPEGTQRMTGAVLQIRLGLLGKATYVAKDVRTTAEGISFGVGVCHAFLYDSKGWVFLLCGEYGGGVLALESTTDDGHGGLATSSRPAGFGQIGSGVEVAYHLGAGFELVGALDGGVRLGQLSAEATDGSRTFLAPSWYASGRFGLGYRF